VPEYALYLESGPRMKTTMVHVLDLLGCIANGSTTEAALEGTPGEIRVFLHFLRNHGSATGPEGTFTTRIAAHVKEGSWIGYGDPAPGFAPDFEPLSEHDEKTYRRRFNELGDELGALVRGLSTEAISARPAKGRSLHEIASHIANAEPEYVRAAGFGKAGGVKDVLEAIEENTGGLDEKLAELWRLIDSHLELITDVERTQRIQRGEKTWTARRGFRRMLEHPWEHLREMQRRLAGARVEAT